MFVQLKKGQLAYNKETGEHGKIIGVDKATYAVEVIVEQNKEEGTRTTKLVEMPKVQVVPYRKPRKKNSGAYRPYFLVRDFHKAFNHPAPDEPTVMDFDTAYNRSKWVLEELIEHMAATDVTKLSEAREKMHEDLDKMLDTELQKNLSQDLNNKEEVLMNQMDALIDQLYFVYGSLVVQGINPKNPFEIVNSCNMDKLQDGQIVYKDAERKKIGKREGWLPPDEDLKAELQRQIEVAKKRAEKDGE